MMTERRWCLAIQGRVPCIRHSTKRMESSGLGGQLDESNLVRVIELNVIWTRKIGPVTTGQTGEAAIARGHIGKLNGYIRFTAKHSAVAIEETARAIMGFMEVPQEIAAQRQHVGPIR